MLYPQQTKALAEKWRAFSDAPYRTDIYAEVQRANTWIKCHFETKPGVVAMLNVIDGYFDEVKRGGIRAIVFVPFPSAPDAYLGTHRFKKYVRDHTNEAIAQIDQMSLLLEVCARVEFIQAEQKRLADSIDDLKDILGALVARIRD